MSSSIVSPFPFFTDTTGAALEGGYIYIGQSNLNPETAPINVFWDSALTIPAGQPIRTVGGYPSRAGTASRMYVSADTYSITVRNKNRVLVFSAFDQSDSPGTVFDISTQIITAVAAQVTFSLTTFTYLPGTDTLQVYRNGLRLNLNLDYIETSSSVVTLTSPAAAGDQFLFQGGTVITGNQVPGSQVAFIQAGVGAITRNMQEKARESVSVLDFGAVGDGVTNDTTAFAIAAALLQPIYVPQTASFYSVTALTSAEQKLLYGPGVVKIAGTQIQISSAPFINNETAHVRVYNQDLQPSKWSTFDGSLFNGAASISAKRTGGFGSYGLSLTEYVVADAIPSNEFDVGVSSWVTAQNLNGGSAYGMWCGANTPSSLLLQAYASGAAIGMEINAGNRWADFGLLPDIGVTRYTVGLQIVPDVLPAPDGATPSVYPGSFGLVIAPSVSGHKWWVGNFTRIDTIVPGGLAYQINGGSSPALATGAMIKGGGYFTRGLDFANTIFSNQAILFGASQTVSWGGSSMSGTATTFGLTTGGTGEGGIYGNNYAQLALRWNSSGSVAQLGFFGAAAVAKPTVTGSKGGNAALASLLTALSNLGLVTNSSS